MLRLFKFSSRHERTCWRRRAPRGRRRPSGANRLARTRSAGSSRSRGSGRAWLRELQPRRTRPTPTGPPEVLSRAGRTQGNARAEAQRRIRATWRSLRPRRLHRVAAEAGDEVDIASMRLQTPGAPPPWPEVPPGERGTFCERKMDGGSRDMKSCSLDSKTPFIYCRTKLAKLCLFFSRYGAAPKKFPARKIALSVNY